MYLPPPPKLLTHKNNDKLILCLSSFLFLKFSIIRFVEISYASLNKLDMSCGVVREPVHLSIGENGGRMILYGVIELSVIFLPCFFCINAFSLRYHVLLFYSAAVVG